MGTIPEIGTIEDDFTRRQFDILVLNAAVALMEYDVTKDGWEQT